MRVVLTAATAAAVCVAGCSPPPVDVRPATLVIGTAQIRVNGTDLDLTDQVTCTVAGPVTTITTGTTAAGLTAKVSNDGTLTAESVNIRNLGGFTGRYTAGGGDQARVDLTGRSYAITGRADGFTTSAPAIQTSGTFTIEVAC